MATELGETAGTIKRQERTWRINIETPFGGVPSVQVFREIVGTLDGEVVSRDQMSIRIDRTLPGVAEQEISVRGRKFTGALLAEVIAAFADKWRTEDMVGEADLQVAREREAAQATAEREKA